MKWMQKYSVELSHLGKSWPQETSQIKTKLKKKDRDMVNVGKIDSVCFPFYYKFVVEHLQFTTVLYTIQEAGIVQ